jgi:hypothetical protein
VEVSASDGGDRFTEPLIGVAGRVGGIRSDTGSGMSKIRS